jgi:hypothetical protein
MTTGLVTCAVCGASFDPQGQAACAACPLHGGCRSLVCCPACGSANIDPSQSKLANWFSGLLKKGGSDAQSNYSPAR